MGRFSALAAMLALLGLATGASAAITIETVTVRDPGNTADSTGFGAVSYLYNIGKYEVTAGQYCAFLNAVAKTDTYGLYNVWMSQLKYYGCGISRSGSDGNYTYTVDPNCVNRPVNYVTFWDACRFANWLHNGQPTGNQDLTTTEDGAYYLNGFTGYDSGQINRKPGAKWALPTENEWYKAAYYKAGGINAGYWLYPTRSDSQPGRDLADASGNNANYQGTPYPIQSPYFFTCVGEFQNSYSAYGTFDQGGNVREWNETVIADPLGYPCRGLRGGSYSGDYVQLQSTSRSYAHPPTEKSYSGFRVVSFYPVPEPLPTVALLGGLAGLIELKRRNK